MIWLPRARQNATECRCKAALPPRLRTQFRNSKIVSRTDLTSQFATTSAWTLTIAQDNIAPPAISALEDRGPVAICFVKGLAADCSEKLYQAVPSEQRWFGTPPGATALHRRQPTIGSSPSCASGEHLATGRNE